MVRMPDNTQSAFNILKDMNTELSILRHDQRLRSLFENAMAGLMLATLEGQVIEANPSFCTFLGYDDPEELIGIHLLDITHPDDHADTRADLAVTTGGGAARASREKRYLRKDGSTRWGLRTASCLYDAAGRPVCRIAMIQDIQERKNLEDELRRSERFWKSLLDSLVDSAYVLDAVTHEILWANASFLREIGLDAEQVQGRSCHDIGRFQAEDHRSFGERCPVGEVTATGKAVHAECQLVAPDGSARYLEISYSPLGDAAGRPQKILYVSRDITQHRLAQRKLEQLARETAVAKRNGPMVAGFFLDIDRFRKINDSIGQAAGDELLREVAWRLRQTVRCSDLVGRLGGDEFAVIAPGVRRLHDTTSLAGKLLEIFRAPFLIDDMEIFVSASLGIALYPEDCAAEKDLLQRAGMAMARAKQHGPGSSQYFSAELNRDARDRLQLENELYRAIDRDQLFLVYQPQIDLESGCIVASRRWCAGNTLKKRSFLRRSSSPWRKRQV